MHDFPPFPGFRPEAFDFLRQLAQNNERDWFKPRKETFDDEVIWPFRCLIVDVTRQATDLDLPLTGDPKRSIFRIYRDTRFSKNKAPYKTHVGAVLSRAGHRKDSGGVYIHIEPENTFMAAGFWRPETPMLRAWRTHMAEAPALFLEMIRRLDAAGLALDHRQDALKRMPRGFENLADSEIGDYLRWKSFIVVRTVPDEALQTPDFTQSVVQMMQDVLPLLEYGWQFEGAVTA